MAEELNCDLDEGSHHDGSDGGSKSSAEDAQEHANDSKETFQPPPEKVEDVLDLDYDEGSPNGNQERAEDGEESSDGEIKDSSDENKSNAANGDKEEGEIDDSDEDDGEIEVDVERTRKVPIEARLSRPSAPVRDRCVKVRECPYEINGSCTWGPDCKYIHRNKEPLRLFSRGKVAEETSWERGLREAREAMRRASKKRQEPEFETKRLNAAPTGERTRTVHDSDSDDVSSPHRRSPHSSRQHIPSLLEIATLPPRFPSRSSSHKDLGPQVRYPCGRPPPPARSDRRGGGGDGNSQRHSSSRQDKVKESAPRSRRESPHSSSSTKAKSRTGRISPSLDASPISSDSSLSPARSPRKTANPTHTDKNVDKKVKKKVQSGSAMGDVTDPWARKKKATSWTKNNNEPKTRGRSSSNSSSSSTNSHEKLRRAAAANLNRNSRLPCSPPVAKVERRLSPPRGDIAGFRIPKKHRAASSRDRTYSSARGNCDSGRDVAFSKKSNVDSHSSKRSDSKKNREPCKLSDDEMEQTIDSRGAENISDSESAQSVSRSSSVMSSSSSQGSSQSRSASPALPAKYRVPGGKEDAPASIEKTVASVSDSEGESKKKNRSKGASKGKRSGASPHLREISPSPSPPPPPPPPDDANSRRRQRDKSETPPPPPPPLPLINEFVLERQARKGRNVTEKRSSAEKPKRERSPPKKKAKGNHDGLTDKERRKRELMEQLRAVEEELKKRTAATSAL
ncbi:unnamed protein product [Haemonchus placei]|uniref:C3H1-type domain-containing protein n=1 Tax=Haemonchus placei TaxID=6290 RepID=A0A0N4W5F6_HAEPC|nr:unnamed protein product [Haemonchus placei]